MTARRLPIACASACDCHTSTTMPIGSSLSASARRFASMSRIAFMRSPPSIPRAHNAARPPELACSLPRVILIRAKSQGRSEFCGQVSEIGQGIHSGE